MKKVLLSAAFVAMAFATFAQDFKPKAGDISFGTSLQSPFASGSPFSLTNGNINARYFLSDKLAVRVGVNYVRNANNADKSDSIATTILPMITPTKKWQEASSFASTSAFNIFLGAEKHFAGTDRLDPYAGADVIFGFGSGYEKDENYNALKAVTETNFMRERTQSMKSIGLALVVGADFYVFPKVYLGTEFGWGIATNFIGEIKETGSYDQVNSTSTAIENKEATPVTILGSKNTSAGAFVNAAFKIGFRF